MTLEVYVLERERERERGLCRVSCLDAAGEFFITHFIRTHPYTTHTHTHNVTRILRVQ